jgi:anti-anti-sigma factor
VTVAPDVQIVDDGRSTRLLLFGEIDVGVAARLAAAAELVVAATPAMIVVDLSATTFLDSSGVGALVSLSNAAAAAGLGTVRLRPGPRNVMRVLDIVGLQDVFELIP